MLASYHTHSTWSDGQAPIAEMLDAARAMKIGELGISDHWVLHPKGTQFKWAMPTDRLAAYVEEVLALRERAAKQGGTILRLGLEVDWFPGHGEALREALEPYPFDYLIGSVHDVNGTLIDMTPASWQKLTQEQVNEVHRQYWINMKSLGESGLFDIVAHIDLAKKFGFYPTIDLKMEIGAALDAIAASSREMVVELNTAGWHKPCEDAYPTLEILSECRRRAIKVTLSADAHQPSHLLRDFVRGAERLRAAGYTEIARFGERCIRMEPIEVEAISSPPA